MLEGNCCSYLSAGLRVWFNDIVKILADGLLVGQLQVVLSCRLSDTSVVGRLDEAGRLFMVIFRVPFKCIFVVRFDNNVY